MYSYMDSRIVIFYLSQIVTDLLTVYLHVLIKLLQMILLVSVL